MPFLDDALNQAIGETIAGEFDMLLGRRTYEIFAAYWPTRAMIIRSRRRSTRRRNTSSRAASTISTGRPRCT